MGSNPTELLTIESHAPTRMDLAGGTVDIWPIYLFLDRPITVNLGIDLQARVRLEENRTGELVLRSSDQNAELKLDWRSLDQVSAPPTLVIHQKLLRFFLAEKKRLGTWDPSRGLTLSTSAKSPAGAGLGGSSCLSVAIIGALATWSRGEIDPLRDGERLIEVTRDVETAVINVPAGIQDYYGGMFGGLQSIEWGTASHKREWLDPSILKELQARTLLFYSGQSRNSGINNWVLFKAFIDQVGPVRKQFADIVEAARELDQALRARDWNAVGQAIAREWSVRRTLASGISTPDMDAAFDLAMKNGATAGKVCGAGGGGCFFVYAPSADPELLARIQERVTSLGAVRALPFQAQERGLEVRVSRA